MSRNEITDQSAKPLADFLLQNNSLQELYLYWNKIGSAAGLSIAEALRKNQSLFVLDLSFNCIGCNPNREAGKAIILAITPHYTNASILSTEQNLKHLDLSNNGFCLEECKAMAEVLKYNQSLYGFHF